MMEKVEINEIIGSAPEFNSKVLFGRSKTLNIRHGRERYLLTITKQNKLLLTKQSSHDVIAHLQGGEDSEKNGS